MTFGLDEGKKAAAIYQQNRRKERMRKQRQQLTERETRNVKGPCHWTYASVNASKTGEVRQTKPLMNLKLLVKQKDRRTERWRKYGNGQRHRRTND